MIPYNEVLQAVARGWCSPKNSDKVMDVDLAEAIAIEVYTTASNHTPSEQKLALNRQGNKQTQTEQEQ
jgi:hypothetical protein